MARHCNKSSAGRLALLWTFSLLVILTLLGISSNGRWNLAPDCDFSKISSWCTVFYWNNDKTNDQVSEIKDNQHVEPRGTQGAIHVVSNIYNLRYPVSFTGEVSDNGYRELNPNDSVTDGSVDSHNDSSQLAGRGLFTSDYDKNSQKGKLLLGYMDNPACAGAKAGTQWIYFDELGKYGWHSDRITADYNHVRGSFGDGEFATMDFSGGTNIAWRHDTREIIGGVDYHATNAKYNNVFWPKQGIIFANDNHNPESRIRDGMAEVDPWKDGKGKPLPIVKLKQWSDIVFLTWQHVTDPSERQNLKWVFRRNVINLMTVKMISEVMKLNHVGTEGTFKGTKITQAPRWPGLEVHLGVPGFEALIGSPNTYGVCWILIQHQKDMGHKTIASITIVDEDTKGIGYFPTMIIKIGEAKEVLYEGT